MSQEYFKDQPNHTCNSVECYFVMATFNKQLEIFHIPVNDVPDFLEEHTFSHMAGLIPRFIKKKKPDVNS